MLKFRHIKEGDLLEDIKIIRWISGDENQLHEEIPRYMALSDNFLDDVNVNDWWIYIGPTWYSCASACILPVRLLLGSMFHKFSEGVISRVLKIMSKSQSSRQYNRALF